MVGGTGAAAPGHSVCQTAVSSLSMSQDERWPWVPWGSCKKKNICQLCTWLTELPRGMRSCCRHRRALLTPVLSVPSCRSTVMTLMWWHSGSPTPAGSRIACASTARTR